MGSVSIVDVLKRTPFLQVLQNHVTVEDICRLSNMNRYLRETWSQRNDVADALNMWGKVFERFSWRQVANNDLKNPFAMIRRRSIRGPVSAWCLGGCGRIFPLHRHVSSTLARYTMCYTCFVSRHADRYGDSTEIVSQHKWDLRQKVCIAVGWCLLADFDQFVRECLHKEWRHEEVVGRHYRPVFSNANQYDTPVTYYDKSLVNDAIQADIERLDLVARFAEWVQRRRKWQN